MFPVVGLLPRDAAIDFEFAGHQIKKGDRLFLACTATHFDPALFPEPERFDLDRYAAPRSEHKTPAAYAPFGLGPHRCLGGNMGELQAMVVAAQAWLEGAGLPFMLTVSGARFERSPEAPADAIAGGPAIGQSSGVRAHGRFVATSAPQARHSRDTRAPRD